MSESHYKDGEVVWVKWGRDWWPGEVWSDERVPKDITPSMRKSVIAFVKFFQEESFEYVKSLNNISKYNCDKKMEYIKKGMDKYRTNNRVMINFPAGVVKAEQLTGGNMNILNTLDTTPTKAKASTTTVTSTPESNKKIVPPSPAATTNKKPAGSYNSSVKVQNTNNTEHKSSENKRLRCTMCNFVTDRMNLLMMHIKNHSLSIIHKPASHTVVESKKSPVKSSSRIEPDDGIAEDVRKIKESMKEPATLSTPARKGRTKAESKVTSTPKPPKKARASKKNEKSIQKLEEKEQDAPTLVSTQPVVAEEKPKINAEELKNELLADWMDEDEVMPEKEKPVEEAPKIVEPPPKPPVEVKKSPEKTGESSRSIRNIPKKQRINEMIVQQEVELPVSVPTTNELPAPKPEVADPVKKSQKGSKRKNTSYDPACEPEKKKMSEDVDEKLLVASAELLSELEVPKVKDSPSTFHKSNDIDKRNLPPKERNKRMFRVKNSPEALAPAAKCVEEKPKVESNEDASKPRKIYVIKNDLQELMLPHKKKQSSRLLPTEKNTESIAIESKKLQETIAKEHTEQIVKSTKKNSRKSSDSQATTNTKPTVPDGPVFSEIIHSPLRETTESPKLLNASSSNDDVCEMQHARGQKRHLSRDSQEDTLIEPDAKKLHKSDSPQPRTLVVACSSETICITSKGNLALARRDSLKTTQANSVVVTSQVIITEATKQPIVSIESFSATTTSPKITPSKPTVTLAPQALKNALKIPKENVEEMKKQGLVKIENNRTKLTPKGLQKFKEFREEKNNITPTSSAEDVSIDANNSQQQESNKSNSLSPEPQENLKHKEDECGKLKDSAAENNNNTKEEKTDGVNELIKESDDTVPQEDKLQDENPSVVVVADDAIATENEGESAQPEGEPNESTNNNEEETETTINEPEIESKDTNFDESNLQKPLENGQEKEIEGDNENSVEDANTGGAGLIALQAETFGGPPNCFYLCRQVEDRYEPVDNQILVLNAQNALVPYEGEVALASTEIVNENLYGYSQLSPNSNIIINTPNGQKIELNHMDILQLQSQADENGIASVALGGEQLELNINGILEAIAAQQEGTETDAMIIEGSEAAIILADATELPVDLHHSATQVSETLSKPIMSTTVAPEIAINPVKSTISDSVSKNLNIEDSLASIGVTTSRANVPKSLELPITVTNPTIAETVNHRKLASAAVESFVVQSTDNGSDD